MKKRTVTIGLVQMRCDDADPQKNLDRALKGIAEAVQKGATIVALPELFLSHYFCQRPDDKTAFDATEPLPGPTTKVLGAVAKEHGIVLVGGSIFEKGSDGKFYNTAPVFGPDGVLMGTYRKTHIPEDILYHEQHYFAPGDTGIKVFDTPFGKICPLICYDQWYPEAARIATLKGAEIIIYPTAIGVVDESVEENITGNWEEMWRNAQLGHAATNNVYVAALNRVGREKNITFWGGSFVADPSSRILSKAGADEEVITATLDLDRVQSLQACWRFLPNRRPDQYTSLTKR
jgi:predicted amidohydrolase